MTAGASVSNNESTASSTINYNALDNKMSETESKPQSNDIDSDDASSCEEDIEEKVLSQSSDDGIFNFEKTTESTKLMADQVLKTAVIKPKIISSFGVAKTNFGSVNGSQLSSSLRPIKETKTSQSLSKTKFRINNDSKDKDVPQDANADTPSSDSKVVFNMLKADLPGRVSFSKNDVYEIDYSDYENDTDTSRSLEPGEGYRKKNVRFEDEFFQMTGTVASVVDENDKNTVSTKSSSGGSSDDDNRAIEINSGTAKMMVKSSNDEFKYCCTLKCNDRECLSEIAAYVPQQSSATPTTSTMTTTAAKTSLVNTKNVDGNDSLDNSEKIIEDYKREIENINRRHELELKWSGNQPMTGTGYSNAANEVAAHSIANNENDITTLSSTAEESNEFIDKEQMGSDYWSSPDASNSPVTNSMRAPSISNASEDSPTRDSTSTVINNYLKTKTNGAISAPPKSTSTTSIKLRTTTVTKKPPTFQSSNGHGRKIKSAQNDAAGKSGQNLKLTKARSISCLQNSANDVAKLNEFHIDKVESWMSTHHEDTFSDTALSTSRKSKFGGSNTNLEYKKAWRGTPTSNKTDDEGNFSLDDQLDTNSVDDSSYGEIELVLKKMEGRRMKISFGNFKIFRFLCLCVRTILFYFIRWFVRFNQEYTYGAQSIDRQQFNVPASTASNHLERKHFKRSIIG